MLEIASFAAVQGPSGFSLALMITASGGSTPIDWDASFAFARSASVRIGIAAAAAVAQRNERRPMRGAVVSLIMKSPLMPQPRGRAPRPLPHERQFGRRK